MENAPLFDELWDYAAPEETAVRFRALLPKYKAEHDASAYIQLLTQLARTQSLQGNFAEAHRLLDQCDEQLTDALPLAQIRTWLERGRTFNSNKQPEKACPLFEKAYRLSLEVDEPFYAIDAAHMLGIAGPNAESRMAWNLTAVKHTENSNNARTKQWLGSLYINIGWSYHDAGDYEKALIMFERTLDYYTKESPNEAYGRIAQWRIGRVMRSLEKYEDALAIQQALAVELDKLEESDGYVQEEIGECLLALGKETAALPHFAQAYHHLSADTWLQKNEPDRLARLKKLGKIA